MAGSEVEVRELIEIGAQIAVDGDGVVSRRDIAIKGPVGFRYPGNLTVQPEVRPLLGFARPAIPVDP